MYKERWIKKGCKIIEKLIFVTLMREASIIYSFGGVSDSFRLSNHKNMPTFKK
jgi:hypothetical protein